MSAIRVFRQDPRSPGWVACEATITPTPTLQLVHQTTEHEALQIAIHAAIQLTPPFPAANGPPVLCLGIERYSYMETEGLKQSESTTVDTVSYRNQQGPEVRRLGTVDEESDSSSFSSSEDTDEDSEQYPTVEEMPLQRDIGEVLLMGLAGCMRYRMLQDKMAEQPKAAQAADGAVTYRYDHPRGVQYSCHCPMLEIPSEIDPSGLQDAIEQTRNASAFILLVDASDRANLQATRHMLELAEPTLEPPAPPMLILAGNSDLPGACSITEVFAIMDLRNFFKPSRREWYVQACSSSWDEYLSGIHWVFEKVSPPPPRPKRPKGPKPPKRQWALEERRHHLVTLGFLEASSFVAFMSAFSAAVEAAAELPNGGVPLDEGWSNFSRRWTFLNLRQSISASLTPDGSSYTNRTYVQQGQVRATIVGPGHPSACQHKLCLNAMLAPRRSIPLYHPAALHKRQEKPVVRGEQPAIAQSNTTDEALMICSVAWGAPSAEMAQFDLDGRLEVDQLPMTMQCESCARAACIKVKNRAWTAPAEGQGWLACAILTICMPCSWKVLEATGGDIHNGLQGCILWDLSRLPEASEAVMLVGDLHNQNEDPSSNAEAIQLRLCYQSPMPPINAPVRFRYCRVYCKGSTVPDNKFVSHSCDLVVTLKQCVTINNSDSSRAHVIEAATRAGAMHLAECLATDDRVGSHLPLLELLVRHTLLRPDNNVLGPLSMQLWHHVLEFSRPTAATRTGSTADELEYAANQLIRYGGIKWTFDNEWRTPFQMSGISTLEYSYANSWEVSKECGAFWSRHIADAQTMQGSPGEAAQADVLINAAVVSVKFPRPSEQTQPFACLPQLSTGNTLGLDWTKLTVFDGPKNYIYSIHPFAEVDATFLNRVRSSPNQRLWHACRAGDAAAARDAISDGAFVHCRNPYARGGSILHAMVSPGGGPGGSRGWWHVPSSLAELSPMERSQDGALIQSFLSVLEISKRLGGIPQAETNLVPFVHNIGDLCDGLVSAGLDFNIMNHGTRTSPSPQTATDVCQMHLEALLNLTESTGVLDDDTIQNMLVFFKQMKDILSCNRE